MNRDTTRALRSLRANFTGCTESTAAMLLQAAKDAGFWLSADQRIGEADLATLLGMAPGSLANKRREGAAPPSYTLGGGGHRVSYRIGEVALWIESHREP